MYAAKKHTINSETFIGSDKKLERYIVHKYLSLAVRAAMRICFPIDCIIFHTYIHNPESLIIFQITAIRDI